MPRSIWKGAIAFGLVHVPVALYPASQEDDIDFDWLDKRSMDPVGYQRINKRTGKTIAKENIVKGVKQEDGSYVVVDDDEIREAYPKTTKTIEIESFVKAEEIPFVYLEKPYFLEPITRADKVYALLREAMVKAGVIGVARVVMHSKEHLAALMPAGPALVLNTLRWATEVRSLEGLKIPGKTAVKESELKMAGQLIRDMSGDWNPDDYADKFTHAIHELAAQRVKAGKTEQVTSLEGDAAAPTSNVVDLTELLKKSLESRKAAPKLGKGSAKPESPAAKTPARKAPAKTSRGGKARHAA